MSAQIKTEKPTYVYPSARKTPTAYDAPATLEWIFDIPDGKMLTGFILDAKLTTVGAGMSLTRISQIFQKIRAFADGKLALDIDQYTLDLVPMSTHWARHQDDYADVSIGTQGVTISKLTQDDINVATGAAMYGYWNCAIPLPVQDQVRFQIDTYGGPAVFGAGMTGGVPQLSIVPIFANIGKRKQYNLYAKRLSSVLRASYRGIEIGAFYATAEFNTISNGIRLGRDLTPEQIFAIESIQANNLMVMAEGSGAKVDNRLNTIKDPFTNAAVFVLADKFDGQAPADFAFTTSQNLQAVVLSESSPDAIEVH